MLFYSHHARITNPRAAITGTLTGTLNETIVHSGV